MADVQIQQTPTSGSGSGWVWAIVVLILLAIIGWFVFGGGLHRTSTTRIEINPPSTSTPAPATGARPGGPGGSSGGTGGGAPRP